MAENLEKNLFEAFEDEDIQAVKDILQKQEINLNCRDKVFFLFISFFFSLFGLICSCC